jgi:protein-S-isoprenylcysteine O-methyltransferase Ste14
MNKRTLQRVRVPLGLVFAIVFIVAARPTPITIAAGAAVAAVGLLIRAWASGHIRKGERLAVTGPYAYTRNPLYLGSFILGLGFTLATGVWWLGLVFAALFLSIYLPVMRIEASDVGDAFGREYDEYAAAVPMFLPRVRPWRKADAAWDAGLYKKHREYEAAIGTALAMGLLVLKMYVFS